MFGGKVQTLGFLPQLQQRTFVAVLRFLVDSEKNILTEYDVLNNTFIEVPRPFILSALGKLRDAKLLDTEIDQAGDFVGWVLHPKIVEEAYDFARGGYEMDSTTVGLIPAADRFVALKHNSPEYQVADAALEELAEEVRKSNDLFANADYRLAVIQEVRGIKETISGKAVRLAALLPITKERGVLALLMTETFSGTIRALATKAVEAIGTLIHLVIR